MSVARAVVTPSLALLAVSLGAVFLVERTLTARITPNGALAAVAAFSIVQFLGLVALVFTLLARKARNQKMERRAERWMPGIRLQLSEHAAGDDRTDSLRALTRQRGTLVELCLIEAIGSLRGEGRRRLESAACKLGFSDLWRKRARSRGVAARHAAITALAVLGGEPARLVLERALSDPDSKVRLTAARALVGSDAAAAEQVFRAALSQPLLVRALVAEDLQPHAADLCRRVMPSLAGREEMLRGLEIASAWRTSARISQLEELARSEDPEMAAAALQLLPYAGDPGRLPEQVVSALRHPAATVRRMAAEIAGRSRISTALSALALGLTDRDPEACRACAFALARLGEEAWPLLEAEVFHGSARARVAMEALEFAHTGRMETLGR